jgi:hypothetical protein
VPATGWTVADTSVLLGGVVRINSAATTDARLGLRRLTRSGTVQGQPIAGAVTVANGRATGTATNPSPNGPSTVTVDVAVPAGTISLAALGAAIPLMRWAPDARHTVTVLDESKGTILTLTLAVTGREQVTVPAGTFETYRVEQAGGEQPVTYNVDAAAGHRVVRQTVGAQIESVLVR